MPLATIPGKIRLFSARKDLRESGCLDEAEQQIFAEAQQVIPNWPGFRRLSLIADERSALQFCEEETEDFMQDIRKDASIFAATDEGGGAASFIAYPKAPPPGEV